jgi:hypothetical protein
MNADYISTVGASILFLLVFEECFFAFDFKFPQVLHHAHVIAFAVSLVEVCKVFAGHRNTLGAR